MSYRYTTVYCLLRLLFIVSMSFTSLDASQVVLVTGASRGIGLAIAKQLAAAGYTVYAGYRAVSAMDELCDLQQRFPDHLKLVTLDVTDQNTTDQAIAEIIANDGHIDVLVNNAGIGISGSVENITIAEGQAIFDVNFFGAIRVTQAVLPYMRKQEGGRIIQISSRSGFRPVPWLSVYAASKFALEGLSETMAATLKPWNIHVSVIEPGGVTTDLEHELTYGSRLLACEDPYIEIFTRGGWANTFNNAQPASVIAAIVQEVVEAEMPLFRYQTSPQIRDQAAQRLVDVTGRSSIEEWHQILFGSD